ncbi:MAG: hypothetical protein WBC63_00675 [Candidatus Bipolaricaulia bacterium]
MSGNNKCGVLGSNLSCALWLGGWLFTLGFTQLVWWQAILGLVIWPYYLAVYLR